MSSTNQDIEQLLTLCSAGNQNAQLVIYNRYYKAMYNTSLRIVKDSFKAEDIMQESFLTAFKKIDTLKNKAVFGGWLKRIVVNNSIEEYNRTVKESVVQLDTVLYKVEDNSGITDNDTQIGKVKHILLTIKQLKSNYRLGLTLHLIEGYDYEEISTIMNISNANCRTMISRAKESLRKKLSVSA